jgi:hypothetical protein
MKLTPPEHQCSYVITPMTLEQYNEARRVAILPGLNIAIKGSTASNPVGSMSQIPQSFTRASAATICLVIFWQGRPLVKLIVSTMSNSGYLHGSRMATDCTVVRNCLQTDNSGRNLVAPFLIGTTAPLPSHSQKGRSTRSRTFYPSVIHTFEIEM